MSNELTNDPLLEEALESLRKARMLLGFARDTLKYPDIRKALKDEVNEAAGALDDAIESVSYAVARTADANAILSLFLYRHLGKDRKEEKDERKEAS